MVLAISGTCSFCTKGGDSVFGLAGRMGRSARICNECVGLCLDIMGEEIEMDPRGREPFAEIPVPDELELPPELERAIAELREESLERMQRLLDEDERRMAEQPRLPAAPAAALACSFCDKPQSEVAKLIAGPSAYVCDLCVGDAAAILSTHSGLRA